MTVSHTCDVGFIVKTCGQSVSITIDKGEPESFPFDGAKICILYATCKFLGIYFHYAAIFHKF